MMGKIRPLTTKKGKTSHKTAENGLFLRNSVPYGQKFRLRKVDAFLGVILSEVP